MKIYEYGEQIRLKNTNYICFVRHVWQKALISEPSFHWSGLAYRNMTSTNFLCMSATILNDLDDVIGGKSYLMRYKYFA